MKVTLNTFMDTPLNREQISAMRRSYGETGLPDVDPDPFVQFLIWLDEARKNPYIVEANAMVLSTGGGESLSSRTVLLKDLTADGFSFFTNYESRKASQIAESENVALLFPWYAMERQVQVQGVASKLSSEESDAYFATRPWGSQIGAWASDQSRELDSRETLEARYKEFAERFPEGSTVPRPPHWGGYIVRPTSIELWQGRYSRLHDRIRYIASKGAWETIRLFP